MTVEDKVIVGKMLPAAAGHMSDHMEMIGRDTDLGQAGRNIVKSQECMRPGIIGGMTASLP